MSKRFLILLFVIIAIGSAVWAAWHFGYLRRITDTQTRLSGVTNTATFEQWSAAVEQVKAPRSDAMGGAETPPELKHYSERYWFLATQVAEVARHNVQTCQDYFDLAAMLQRGEMVSVPGVTETYVLYGVAERVDDSEFNSDPENSVAPDYGPLQTIAQNFGGRSYNLASPEDRKALKSKMLSSLRPAALRIMETVASAYHSQFGRPLPVSSLVRPEQYQHALKRVNRNAVLIETPPHSTGLAFDIDYRYMSAAEQKFVMAELARLKKEGRIEAIRERNANYHVFAFIDGTRPNDDLIAAKLEEAMPPGRDAHHADEKSKPKNKPAKVRPKRKRRR